MDYALWFQLSWALAALGWLIAAIAVRKGWTLWRINGELAQRYHKLKKKYDKLAEEHQCWCEEGDTDPGVKL